jgi:hypothetical protein
VRGKTAVAEELLYGAKAVSITKRPIEQLSIPEKGKRHKVEPVLLVCAV